MRLVRNVRRHGSVIENDFNFRCRGNRPVNCKTALAHFPHHESKNSVIRKYKMNDDVYTREATADKLIKYRRKLKTRGLRCSHFTEECHFDSKVIRFVSVLFCMYDQT